MIQEFNDGWIPDWSAYQNKYHFRMNHEDGDIVIGCTVFDQIYLGECYFKFDDIGEEIMERLGKEKIKLALWGIE